MSALRRRRREAEQLHHLRHILGGLTHEFKNNRASAFLGAVIQRVQGWYQVWQRLEAKFNQQVAGKATAFVIIEQTHQRRNSLGGMLQQQFSDHAASTGFGMIHCIQQRGHDYLARHAANNLAHVQLDASIGVDQIFHQEVGGIDALFQKDMSHMLHLGLAALSKSLQQLLAWKMLHCQEYRSE